MKFEWDKRKESINIQKHGVTFEEASYVFSDIYALSRYDNEHSEDEDREEYDFTNAEQGKFYVPIDELDIPIYLDEEVKRFFLKRVKEKR